MNQSRLLQWLFENSSPILKYRMAVEFDLLSTKERKKLLNKVLPLPEVRYWFGCLKKATNIHGSKDIDAENALAKLLDFGFDKEIPEFDRGIKRLLQIKSKPWDNLVLLPFLIRAGYETETLVNNLFTDRFEKLLLNSKNENYKFFITQKEAALVPKPWREKPIYRDEFGHREYYPIPTCYDFYAISYSTEKSIADIERIVKYLSNNQFQSVVDGYGWDKEKRRCYSAGRVFLACVLPARLILFLELGARFQSARKSAWFRKGIHALEKYKTPRGTYCFPSRLLQEKVGNHLYGGSHMGLGEKPRSGAAIEVESTFHMLYITNRIVTNT